MHVRIIAKLDVKPPFVVKPVHFEGLRKVGLPSELAKKYYDQGADEIMYIDIVSSLYGRKILYSEILNTANELFIPFGVGGGVQTIEDFSRLIHSGADKVAVNTYPLRGGADLINEASQVFGRQAVVVNIEAKRSGDSWECYTDCGRIPTGKDVFEWMLEVEDRGAGEIFLQSVDCDGRKLGFELELAKKAVSLVNIPVVIASGAGGLDDVKSLIKFAKPSGVAISSILHYDKTTIRELKQFLRNNDIEVSK